MIAKFVLNAVLHHVGMSWTICSNEEMKYEIDKIKHQYLLNKGPWYSTSVGSRLHGSLFADFITHAGTDRYNIIFYLVAHDKKQPAYEDEENSIGEKLIPKHVTTEAFEALGDTLSFIKI